jgi:hypothetical protein
MRFRFFCLLLSVFIGSTPVMAQEVAVNIEKQDTLCLPSAKIVLMAPESIEMELTPVQFPHATHFSYSCYDCHHKWDGTAEIKSCTTSGCHDVITTPETPLTDGEYTNEAIKYYKYAYHEQCRPCHKDVRLESSKEQSLDEAESTAPTGCVECHPKDE